MLYSVFLYETDKGLNINLNIGDDEQEIEKKLVTADTQSNTEYGFFVYSYPMETKEVFVFVKDNSVQAIAMQFRGKTTIDEAEQISNYYNTYNDQKQNDNSIEQNDLQEELNQPKENIQDEKFEKEDTIEENKDIKSFSRNELMNLYVEVNNAHTLYLQTTFGGYGDSVEDELKILEEAFDKNDFWDKGIELEEAESSIKVEDISWYNFVVSYMNAVDSEYTFQILAYKMVQSGEASEDEINNTKNMAAQASKEASLIYNSAKGRLFP
jgi:hypothetical protein